MYRFIKINPKASAVVPSHEKMEYQAYLPEQNILTQRVFSVCKRVIFDNRQELKSLYFLIIHRKYEGLSAVQSDGQRLITVWEIKS